MCWQNNRTRLRWLLNISSCFVPMGRCTCQATWSCQFHHFPQNLSCLNHFESTFQLVLPHSSSYNPRIQTARDYRTVSTQTPFSWNKEQIDELTALRNNHVGMSPTWTSCKIRIINQSLKNLWHFGFCLIVEVSSVRHVKPQGPHFGRPEKRPWKLATTMARSKRPSIPSWTIQRWPKAW